MTEKAEKVAGFFSEDKIAEVRESSNIVDIIGSYVSLKKVGNNYVGLCPFHSEKTPSFSVSPEKNIFYCFGCQTGGNVFTFLMKMENLPFAEALARLATRAGIALPQTSGKRGTTKTEELFRLNAQVADYYHQLLTESNEGGLARKYLQDRGISTSTVKEYKLGYAQKSWNGLLRFLTTKGVSLDLAASLGLIIRRDELSTAHPEPFYDRFRDRIIFPIQDGKGRVLGFGGRILGEDMPKYMNSPDSVIYRKGDNLYGIQVAGNEIKTKGWAVLVEGYFDLLAPHQHGIKNVVATLGTALTERQVELLINQGCQRVIMLFDADTAGIKAAARGLVPILNTRGETQVVQLPSGEDPDSFIRKEGKERFLMALKDATPFEHFLVDNELSDLDLANALEQDLQERLTPILEKIKDNLKKQRCVHRMLERLEMKGFRIPHLDRLVERLLAPSAPAPLSRAGEVPPLAGPKAGQAVVSLNEEELLITILLQDGRFIARARELQILEEIAHPALKKIAEMLILKYEGLVDSSKLIDDLEDDSLKGLVSRLSLMPPLKEEAGTAFADCVRKLILRKVRQREREIAIAIKEAEEKGDAARLRNLLSEKVKLKNHIKTNLFRGQ